MSKTNAPISVPVVPSVTITPVQLWHPDRRRDDDRCWRHECCGCVPCRCGTSSPCNDIVKTW